MHWLILAILVCLCAVFAPRLRRGAKRKPAPPDSAAGKPSASAGEDYAVKAGRLVGEDPARAARIVSKMMKDKG